MAILELVRHVLDLVSAEELLVEKQVVLGSLRVVSRQDLVKRVASVSILVQILLLLVS